MSCRCIVSADPDDPQRGSRKVPCLRCNSEYPPESHCGHEGCVEHRCAPSSSEPVTARDLFAAAALHAYIVTDVDVPEATSTPEMAFKIADAMMAARGKR